MRRMNALIKNLKEILPAERHAALRHWEERLKGRWREHLPMPRKKRTLRWPTARGWASARRNLPGTSTTAMPCDAFGVLMPVSSLSPAHATYHFISGYKAGADVQVHPARDLRNAGTCDSWRGWHILAVKIRMCRSFVPLALVCSLLALDSSAGASHYPEEDVPLFPTRQTPEQPGLDSVSNPVFYGAVNAKSFGPIAPASSQPIGVLSGRVVFTSGGHGWNWTGSSWALDRPSLAGMNEDTGNVDQMTMFAYQCFNAGATVVPMRPVGNQTNEVVLDNVSPSVTWAGSWTDSSSAVYFGAAGALPYRFANASLAETATATYTPNIPVAGFYPVYGWALSGANRVNQLYRINHSGGQSLVRVPHQLVGGGWVYLGTYYFNAGVNAAAGAVIISNQVEGTNTTGVVVADAIRFGNGMGDVNEGGGVSTYPREDECSRMWIRRALGQGQSTSPYDNGNVGAPPRMAAEMNREAEGNIFKRIYIGFHSNATTGNTNTATARGVTALWNNPGLSTNVATSSDTPNQYRLAQLLGTEVNSDMLSISAPPLEFAWANRASITYANPSFAYGEINNNIILDEFDATIVEVAFHDNTVDAALLRDPKTRNWIARSVLHGYIRYLNQFDGVPLNFPPEPPYNVRVIGGSNQAVVAWNAPVSQAGSGAASGYVVSRSSDGYGFGNPVTVSGATTLSFTITNLVAGTDYYFRVSAVNGAGESTPSETVGCRLAASPYSSRVLYVNGFTRYDRTLNLRQTLGVENYKPPGHDRNTGAIERVSPRRNNSFDYVVPHGKSVVASSLMAFDSCQVQAVTNGMVNLLNYGVLIWACGNQTVAQRTFNPTAQSKIAAFRAAGGHLFVSGADVAWDLGRTTGPTAADRAFLTNQLHAALGNDTNNSSGIFTFSPVAGSLFVGNATGTFDDGSKGIYWVGSPEALTPVGLGAASALTYPGYSGGSAAIRYDGSAGGGKVVFFGFPFEAVTSAALRTSMMDDILKFFSRPARIEGLTLPVGGKLGLTVSGEPGLMYNVQASADLVSWATITNAPNPSGTFAVEVPAPQIPARYFRVALQW